MSDSLVSALFSFSYPARASTRLGLALSHSFVHYSTVAFTSVLRFLYAPSSTES